MQLDKRKNFQVLEIIIIIGALKKTIDNVKFNGGVDGMTEQDKIKHKEKNMREERMMESVRDIEGVGLFHHQWSERVFLRS